MFRKENPHAKHAGCGTIAVAGACEEALLADPALYNDFSSAKPILDAPPDLIEHAD